MKILKYKRIKPNLLKKRNDLIYRLFVDEKMAMEDIAKIFRLDTGFVYEIVRHQKVKDLIISKK
jgi:hypothetical protein